MLSSERLTHIVSKPILRAITSIHSRVRTAVFPARSIEAPNQASASDSSSGEAKEDFVTWLEGEATPVSHAIN
jgi:hypothetical protein